MNNNKARRVTIIGGKRIPFSRAYGEYRNVTSQQMMTAALKGLVDAYDLTGGDQPVILPLLEVPAAMDAMRYE